MNPPAAERTRTVLTHASPVMVDIGDDVAEAVDVLGVDADGSLMLQVGAEGAIGARVSERAVACAVDAALVSPVPGPDRILDRVTVFGRISLAADLEHALQVIATDRRTRMIKHSDESVLLRVTIGHLRLESEDVDLGAYARARPDPLAAASDHFVEHLARGHAQEILQLAHLFTPAQVRGMRALAPIRVDRFGLTFRIDARGGSMKARLDFPAGLGDPGELAGAMQELQRRAARVTSCPFG